MAQILQILYWSSTSFDECSDWGHCTGGVEPWWWRWSLICQERNAWRCLQSVQPQRRKMWIGLVNYDVYDHVCPTSTFFLGLLESHNRQHFDSHNIISHQPVKRDCLSKKLRINSNNTMQHRSGQITVIPKLQVRGFVGWISVLNPNPSFEVTILCPFHWGVNPWICPKTSLKFVKCQKSKPLKNWASNKCGRGMSSLV